ncbi:hypothetical protein GCM10010168_56090 [Actinoplanes ianthinogenes]|uniref:Uncharacterized protein n=1 Tax=Actinoplanes ianthinogenes TaxID=122358 RepID=A0ABM7LQ88_9ACTN|nr:hypothetical protein [Actinoplanes ianthinogenes]BCJ41392.1 hypothetical protein Aiant_20490 [Actinoplanes ianthinogenes]GGR30460.1 hypothetical protein GCM10010168_56090 [Actinoplanes ianthinogenes]
MAQAGEPRGNEEEAAATTSETAAEPAPAAAGEISPEVIELLRAATAKRDRPEPSADNSVTRVLPTVTSKAAKPESGARGAEPESAGPSPAEKKPESGPKDVGREAAETGPAEEAPTGANPVAAAPAVKPAAPGGLAKPAPAAVKPTAPAGPAKSAPPVAVRSGGTADGAQADGGPRSGRTERMWASWSRRTWVTGGGIAAVVLLLGVWAVSGSGGVDPLPGATTEAVVAPLVPPTSASPTGSVAPQAATRPARTAADLDQVCGNTYFPAAPKFRGKGPHPIVISVRDRLDLDQRSTRTLNRYAYGSKLAQRTWAPAAAKAELVACVDLVGGGAKVKDCPGDGKTKLPLQVGRYRLSLYEAATRRKIAEVALEGAEKACPWVVMTGADATLYTTIGDDQLYRVLRPRVVQGAAGSAQPKKRS